MLLVAPSKDAYPGTSSNTSFKIVAAVKIATRSAAVLPESNRPRRIRCENTYKVTIEFRRRYGYDHRGRIVTDTIYTFAALTDPLETVHKEGINTYTCDKQNRIISVDGLHVPTSGKFVSRNFYNQKGNLERIDVPGGAAVMQYDSFLNMHRAHPIWQFIDRDFSINNPFHAVAYNSHGLPVALQSPPCVFSASFVGIEYKQVDVNYQCDGAAPS